MEIKQPTVGFLIAYIPVMVIAAVMLTPFCGFIYKCGCTHLWDGGMSRCNVFEPSGPQCPWCVAGQTPLVGMIPVLTIFGGGSVAMLRMRRRMSSPYLLFLAGLTVFALLGLAIGWVFKIVYDYPYFLF